jgi:hypothetical protein
MQSSGEHRRAELQRPPTLTESPVLVFLKIPQLVTTARDRRTSTRDGVPDFLGRNFIPLTSPESREDFKIFGKTTSEVNASFYCCWGSVLVRRRYALVRTCLGS